MTSATAPLDLYLCESCGHLQLLDIVDPNVQYSNFTYVTSISKALIPHFEEMANELIDMCELNSKSFVVEIGSNDGTLLKNFLSLNCKILGIDPAEAIANRATANGIKTLPAFFNNDLSRKIVQDFGKANCIISNNTFANLDELDGIVLGIKNLLSENGLFVFETQYGLDVIQKLLIDTVYHEHLSYFTVFPLVEFFKKNGLKLISVKRVSTKGGSIRGYVSLADSRHATVSSVEELISIETQARIRDLETYREFSDKFEILSSSLSSMISKIEADGHKVGAFGASVGTVTLLNQFQLGPKLSVIYDDLPLTNQITGPNYNIPVQTSDQMMQSNCGYVLILAWRYAEQIIQKNRVFIERGGKFIVPWPELAVHDENGVRIGY